LDRDNILSSVILPPAAVIFPDVALRANVDIVIKFSAAIILAVNTAVYGKSNQIKNIQDFCNFCGTGSGKTLSSEPLFYAKYDENKCLYLVLDHDKFSQEDSPNLVNLVNQFVQIVNNNDKFICNLTYSFPCQ
jgi:hypothetical protein